MFVIIAIANKRLLITGSSADLDPPRYSFQKFYIDGTNATNITPTNGAFGKISLRISLTDYRGNPINPPQLHYNFSVHNQFLDQGQFIPWFPTFEIWVEGHSSPWDPCPGECTWNGMVWVCPSDYYMVGWTTNDYYKQGIIHCAWDDNYKPFSEWPKLSEIN